MTDKTKTAEQEKANIKFEDLKNHKTVSAYLDDVGLTIEAAVVQFGTCKPMPNNTWDESGVMYQLTGKARVFAVWPSTIRFNVFNQDDCNKFRLTPIPHTPIKR